MPTNVTEERIELTAVDKFSSVLNQAQGQFKGLGSSIATVQNALTAVGVTVGAGAMVALAKDIVHATAALDDMAEQTGATVEGLSKIQTVAKIGGHEFGGVTEAIGKMVKGLKGADEEGQKASAALEFLNVKAKDNNGRFRDTAEILQDVAKALVRYEDGGNKVALVQDLLGKSGARYLSLLKDMAEEGDLHAKVTAQQAAEAEKLEKNLNRMAIVAEDAKRAFVMGITPAIVDFTEKLLAATKASGNLIAGLATMATAGTGGNIGARLKEIDAEIARREALDPSMSDKLGEAGWTSGFGIAGKIMGFGEKVGIGRLMQEREYLLAEQRRQALSGAGPENWDMRDRRLLAPQALNYQSPGGAAGSGRVARTGDEFRDAEAMARKQVELEQMAIDDMTEAWQAYDRQRIEQDKKVAEERARQQKEYEAALRKWAEEEERQNEKRIREFERTADIIEHSLTDALMRGFESGRGFAENFRQVLVDMFKTLVLRPIIQPVAQGAAGLVLGGLGMGAANAAGGWGGHGGIPGGGMMDFASLGSNLYSAFSGNSVFSGIGSMLGIGGGGATIGASLSTVGNAAMVDMALGGVGGTLGGEALIAGAAPSLGAALPWVGGALAIGGALGLFGGGGLFGKKKKQPHAKMHLERDAAGQFYVWGDDVPGPSARSDFAQLNAALNDPMQYDQDILAGMVGNVWQYGRGEDAQSLMPEFMGVFSGARSVAEANAARFTGGMSAATGALGSLRGWASSLATSPYLSPLDQLSGARANFESLYAAAMGGDGAAAAQLQSAGSTFLSAGRSVYASGKGFQDIWSQVKAAALGVTTSAQSSFEDILRETPASIQSGFADQIAAIKAQTAEMVAAIQQLSRDFRQGSQA